MIELTLVIPVIKRYEKKFESTMTGKVLILYLCAIPAFEIPYYIIVGIGMSILILNDWLLYSTVVALLFTAGVVSVFSAELVCRLLYKRQKNIDRKMLEW